MRIYLPNALRRGPLEHVCLSASTCEADGWHSYQFKVWLILVVVRKFQSDQPRAGFQVLRLHHQLMQELL